MPKISKQMQWFLILSVSALAIVFLLPNNNATTTSHPKTKHSVATTDASGVSYEDLNAHFPRYHVSSRNPFVPLVAPPSPQVGALPGVGTAMVGPIAGWTLTGISTVDGAMSALVENSATNDRIFLHVGDAWQGLLVKSIDSGGVLLTDLAGTPTRLTFVTTMPDTSTAGTPSVSSITPLAPMPIAGGRRARRGGAQPDTSVSPGASSESNSQP